MNDGDELRLDGNAAGGVLGAIFPFEMTVADGTCIHCGATSEIGAVVAYMSGIGTVLRCPSCEQVLIKIVESDRYYWLDMSGVRSLRITKPPEQ